MTWPNGAGVNTNQWGPWEPVPANGPPPPAENVAPPVLSPPSSDPSGMLNTQFYLSEVLAIGEPQQGTNAISNVAQITASFAGIAASQLQVFNWSGGNPATSSSG